MTKQVIHNALLFIVLVLLQAIIFNHICIFNVAVPFVFLYFLVHLPINSNKSLAISLAFLLGLTVDVFSNTLGMNALACTLISTIRRPIINLYLPHEEGSELTIVSVRAIGLAAYMKYAFTFALIYCFMIFTIQAFSFFHLKLLIFRVIGSTILNFLILLGIECINGSSRAKEL